MAERRDRSISMVPEHHTPPSELPSPKKVKKSHSTPSRHPTFSGIRLRSGKWVSEIREPKKTTRIWLGTYTSPEMAAAAYDVAALALKGGDASLNFPDRASLYPVPDSNSAADIRQAAASAARMIDCGQGSGKIEPCLTPEASRSECGFVDEEELLNMHNLLVDMAGGLLVSPPRLETRSSPENSDGGESLWSY